jgi:hypothetical protein
VIVVTVSCSRKSKRPSAIDRNQIRRVIQTNKASLSKCFDREQIEVSTDQAKVVLVWLIDDSGVPSGLRAEETFDPKVSDCLINIVKGLRFPPTAKGTIGQVRHPFIFNTEILGSSHNN